MAIDLTNENDLKNFIKTQVKLALKNSLGNKKTSDYTAVPGGIINDNWLLDLANAGVLNYKGTALEFKNYVGTGQEIFDATVGNIGSGADYNSQEDAIIAGKFSLLIIGNFNETKDVNVGATSVNILIADTCNMGVFQYFTGGAGDLTFNGKVTYAYTSPRQLVTHAGTGTLDMSNAITDGTACTAVSSIAVGNAGNRMQISNCRCYLANTISSGFINAYNSSSVSNVTFIGGGSACTGAIVNLAGGLASNITFEGTFLNLSEIIKFQNAPSILSGVRYNATNRGVIGLYVDANQIDNLNGDLGLDPTDTSAHQISNCYISEFDTSDASSGRNKISNMHITTEDMVIEGGFNQFVNFESDADVTINGSANWLSHARAVNVIDNGTSNESFLCSYTSYVDNGSSNSYITAISEDGTLAANSNLEVVTQKAIKTALDTKVNLNGLAGGQEVHGGTLTTETLDLLNNLIDALGIHIAGDGTVTIDRDTTIGEAGTAGVVEVKDASDVVKAKLNSVGDSFVIGGNTGFGTATPNATIDNQGSKVIGKRVISAATGSLNSTDSYLQMAYTATGAIAFDLLTAQSIDGRVIDIKDTGDNASVNNITVTTEGGETIEGAATLVINGDGENYTLRYDAANTNWEIF